MRAMAYVQQLLLAQQSAAQPAGHSCMRRSARARAQPHASLACARLCCLRQPEQPHTWALACNMQRAMQRAAVIGCCKWD